MLFFSISHILAVLSFVAFNILFRLEKSNKQENILADWWVKIYRF